LRAFWTGRHLRRAAAADVAAAAAPAADGVRDRAAEIAAAARAPAPGRPASPTDPGAVVAPAPLVVGRLSLAEERRNLTILWIGAYLTSASWSLVIPFLPIYLRQLGVPSAHLSTWTGIAFSATFVTAVVCSPIWGAWADAVGRKPNLLRSGVAITVVMLGLGNASAPWVVVVWRLLNGALSGFIPASFALVAATVPEKRIGRSLGVLQSGPAAGAITGPLIGGLLVQLWGIHWTFYLAAAAQLTATVLVYALVREPEPPRRGLRLDVLGDLRAAVRNPLLVAVLATTVLVQLAVTIVEPLITIYVGEFPGVSAVPLLAGLLFSLVGVASVLCSPAWGRWGERLGYRRIVLLGLIGAGVGNALQLLAGSLWAFGGVRLGIGAAYAGATTGLNTLAAVSVEDAFRGRAYGILTSSQQVGNLCGPLIGGFWGDAFGIRSSFGLSAAVFAAALVCIALVGRGAATPTPARPGSPGPGP